MTIETTTRLAGPFSGNGATTAFDFSFKVFDETDLLVFTRTSGVDTTQTLTTHYTVSLNSDQDSDPGGTVTFVTAPASGTSVYIQSNIPATQSVSVSNAGGFYPAVANNAWDRAVALIQQLDEEMDRTLRVPVGSSVDTLPSDGANNEALASDGLGGFKYVTLSEQAYVESEVVNRSATKSALTGVTAADNNIRYIPGVGHYIFDANDLSTEVGNDEVTSSEGDGGIYTAPASDKTGASGAWKVGETYVTPEAYGCSADGSDESTEFEAFLRGCMKNNWTGIIPPGKTYSLTNATITGTNESAFPAPERLKIIGMGGKIQALDPTDNTIFVESVHNPKFEGVEFVGTSDAAVTYNARSLLRFNQCSRPEVIRSHFSKGVGFGVWVERCQPATEHLGALIDGCVFINWGYDVSSDLQAGIFLQDNGEYNQIVNSRMHDCPAFIRGVGGANTLVMGNILMASNRTAGWSNNHGVIFFESGATNEGKINICHNKINHNEVGMWAINITGDGTNTRNANRIIGNEFLVHGDASNGEFIRIRGYSGNVISQNKLRSNNSSPTGYAIWLDNATAIATDNEFEQVGDAAWRLFDGSTTAIVSATSGAAVLTIESTSYFPWDRLTAGQDLTISGGTSIDGTYEVDSFNEGAGTITMTTNFSATVASVSATLALSGSITTLIENGNIYADKSTAYSLASSDQKIVFQNRRSFSGAVSSAGGWRSGCDLETLGWSVSSPSTGTYTITHNLGSTDYDCIATMDNGSTGFITVTRAANTITVETDSTAGANGNRNFSIMVNLWNEFLRAVY